MVGVKTVAGAANVGTANFSPGLHSRSRNPRSNPHGYWIGRLLFTPRDDEKLP
jgi:hypothetical protein